MVGKMAQLQLTTKQVVELQALYIRELEELDQDYPDNRKLAGIYRAMDNRLKGLPDELQVKVMSIIADFLPGDDNSYRPIFRAIKKLGITIV